MAFRLLHESESILFCVCFWSFACLYFVSGTVLCFSGVDRSFVLLVFHIFVWLRLCPFPLELFEFSLIFAEVTCWFGRPGFSCSSPRYLFHVCGIVRLLLWVFIFIVFGG